MKKCKKALLCLSFFLFCLNLHADTWTNQVSQQVNVNDQAQYRFITFNTTPEDNNMQSIDVNEVVLRKNHYAAKIVDQNLNLGFFGAPRINDTAKQYHAFLAINAGFFTPNNEPLGLLIRDGKLISRYIHSSLLSGMITIDKQGLLSISPAKNINAQNMPQINDVFQAGPVLFNADNNVTIRQSNKTDRRTVLALTNQGDLIILITTPISLYDLSQLIKNQENVFAADGLKIAINLDGGTSTAMSLFLPKQRPLVVPEILPVRNALLFTLN